MAEPYVKPGVDTLEDMQISPSNYTFQTTSITAVYLLIIIVLDELLTLAPHDRDHRHFIVEL